MQLVRHPSKKDPTGTLIKKAGCLQYHPSSDRVYRAYRDWRLYHSGVYSRLCMREPFRAILVTRPLAREDHVEVEPFSHEPLKETQNPKP